MYLFEIEKWAWIKAGVVLVVFFSLFFILTWSIKKKVGIKGKTKYMTDHHKTLTVFIGILFLVLVFLNEFIFRSSFLYYFWIGYVILILGLQAYMEWKYHENRRAYFLPLSQLLYSALFLLLIQWIYY
ncbi:DUF4181 domain-containing protein [Halobacillus salinarum]|uniref:DUF4181 domain-containing protein n=1 Tax=Halobacillus salinarum TaxID=2932257 RepID=A0ABY4EIW1_9BACI|nr:DUF4181 domain-containing protein [Halobacillus salinarum]UOQ43993.1 DUF4181 domain-containing protein [Halobacillus salinarum]